MPLYDFSCSDCDHHFEQLVRREADVPQVTCPKCAGGHVHRQLSLPAAPLSSATAQSNPSPCGSGPPCGASWCQRTG